MKLSGFLVEYKVIEDQNSQKTHFFSILKCYVLENYALIAYVFFLVLVIFYDEISLEEKYCFLTFLNNSC